MRKNNLIQNNWYDPEMLGQTLGKKGYPASHYGLSLDIISVLPKTIK